MEKCTFCVHRIRRAQDTAKDEKRSVRDGEIQPACAQACPAKVLVFGDLSDPDSQVSQLADRAGDTGCSKSSAPARGWSI